MEGCISKAKSIPPPRELNSHQDAAIIRILKIFRIEESYWKKESNKKISFIAKDTVALQVKINYYQYYQLFLFYCSFLKIYYKINFIFSI